ncbi:MAG: LytTR family DNA-binding domain-containing protein [Bacteroidota bacterium]
MKVALVDDDRSMRENLKALLEKHAPETLVVGEASGVSEGLSLLSTVKIDVLFLDVEMKDGTGFDLLARHGQPAFDVIFVTGHDRYAIKAFRYSAIDYLLKPVDPMELSQALSKIKSEQEQGQLKRIGNLIGNWQKHESDYKIVLKDSDSVYLVAVKEIIRCQADNNYTVFFLEGDRKIMVSRTLKDYERMFENQQFFRTHQSHLINLDFFRKFDRKDGGVILMKDGAKVPLAIRKKESFLNCLAAY